MVMAAKGKLWLLVVAKVKKLEPAAVALTASDMSCVWQLDLVVAIDAGPTKCHSLNMPFVALPD
jgi:hypothetical protein